MSFASGPVPRCGQYSIAAIPERVDQAEASKEAALMEEASPALETQGQKLFRRRNRSGVSDRVFLDSYSGPYTQDVPCGGSGGGPMDIVLSGSGRLVHGSLNGLCKARNWNTLIPLVPVLRFKACPSVWGLDPHKGGGNRLNISAIGGNFARIRSPLLPLSLYSSGIRR
ncbi:hypothetical protein QYF36_020741 [Acer negundo]|nr:hypothetical protein QYF36_020741 [Acer negundo]